MEKINIAELLKDCPKGMELDCTMFDNVTFVGISNGRTIVTRRESVNHKLYLDKYGCPLEHPKEDLKCIIFPKGKTTWEGFVPPCKFKDGDVVADNRNNIAIYKKMQYYGNLADYYCGYRNFDNRFIVDSKRNGHFGSIEELRFATEEEKQKLFDAIKENGYKWNEETKTLEKLVKPEFNVGDWIIRNNKYTGIPVKVIEFNGYYSCELHGEIVDLTRNDVHNNFHLWTIQDAQDGDVLASYECLVLFQKIDGLNIRCYCTYHFMNNQSFYVDTLQNKTAFHPATKEQCDLLFSKMKEMGYKWVAETKTLEKLVEPKFKVGDKVRNKNNHNVVFTITSIEEDSYVCGAKTAFWISDQDNYELVPNKFDITTLKPFDKVLVRDDNAQEWIISFFSHCNGLEKYKYSCINGSGYAQCIAYEGNEHLLGTINDCDEFFKTWK